MRWLRSVLFSSLPMLVFLLLLWLGALAPRWVLGVVGRFDPGAVAPAELVVAEVVCGEASDRSVCTVGGEIVLPDGETIRREVVVEGTRARVLEVGDTLGVVVNVRPGSNVFEGSLRRAAWNEDVPTFAATAVEALRGPVVALGLWGVLAVLGFWLGAVRRAGDESLRAGDVFEIVPRPSLAVGCGPAAVAVAMGLSVSVLAGWGGAWWAVIALMVLGLICTHRSSARIDRRAGTLVRVEQLGPLRRSRPPVALGTPRDVRVATVLFGDPTATQSTRFDLALATREGEHPLGSYAMRSDAEDTAQNLAKFLGVPYAGPSHPSG